MTDKPDDTESQAAIERTRAGRDALRERLACRRPCRRCRLLPRRFHAALFRPQPAGRRPPGQDGPLAILAEVTRRTNRKLLGIIDIMAGPERGALLVRERFERDGKAGIRRLLVYAVRDGLLGNAGSGTRTRRRSTPISRKLRRAPVSPSRRYRHRGDAETTQARPIHTVELNCSPRKITPKATPMGTRR